MHTVIPPAKVPQTLQQLFKPIPEVTKLGGLPVPPIIPKKRKSSTVKETVIKEGIVGNKPYEEWTDAEKAEIDKAVKVYGKTELARDTKGDPNLNKLVTTVFGTQKVKRVSSKTFDKAEGELVFRWLNDKKYVDDDLDGKFTGRGIFGNGQYYLNKPVTAINFSKLPGFGHVHAARILPNARLADYDDMLDIMGNEKLLKKNFPQASAREIEELLEERQVELAIRLGYDGLKIKERTSNPSEIYYLMFNQRKLIVDKGTLNGKRDLIVKHGPSKEDRKRYDAAKKEYDQKIEKLESRYDTMPEEWGYREVRKLEQELQAVKDEIIEKIELETGDFQTYIEDTYMTSDAPKMRNKVRKGFVDRPLGSEPDDELFVSRFFGLVMTLEIIPVYTDDCILDIEKRIEYYDGDKGFLDNFHDQFGYFGARIVAPFAKNIKRMIKDVQKANAKGMSYSKESKREREAREERLGGIFFFFTDDDGNIEWPEHWTQTEIDNYYRHIKEWGED